MSEHDELLQRFGAFEETLHWVMEGPASALTEVLKRVGFELGEPRYRYDVNPIQSRDGRSMWQIVLVEGSAPQNNQRQGRVAQVYYEEIPRGRVHVRVRRADVAQSMEVPFAEFLTKALEELEFLQFVIA